MHCEFGPDLLFFYFLFCSCDVERDVASVTVKVLSFLIFLFPLFLLNFNVFLKYYFLSLKISCFSSQQL